MTDIDAARRFVALHGRLIDRRRLVHLLDGAPGEDVAAALSAYANADGGFAGLLEPDVRTLSSQPVAVLAAFELLDEIGAPAPAAAVGWLERIAGPDGAVPFSLPSVADAPHAPWMTPSRGPSLLMTAALAAAALRLGARGTWVETASAFCRARLAEPGELSAYEVKYAARFLEAVGDEAGLARLADAIPPDGRLHVAGGVEGETLGPLDLAPHPGGAARRLFAGELVEAALDDLEAGQREDGGWDFDWLAWSPVAAAEWRGRVTVDALRTLRASGR